MSPKFYVKVFKLAKWSTQRFAPGFVCFVMLVFVMVCVLLFFRSYVDCGTKATRRKFVFLTLLTKSWFFGLPMYGFW